MIKKSLAMFATSLALVVILYGAAEACSCLQPQGPAEEMKRSSAVFVGKVISIKDRETDADVFRLLEVRFSLSKSWKGDPKSEQVVFTSPNSAACGYPFSEGSSYLVYANSDGENRLVTGLCTRTRKAEYAGSEIEELDKAASTKRGETTALPKWLIDHFTFMTAGSGRWITDNAEFTSENEPFDKYGTEWKWGVGKQSIRGRLFGMNGSKEAGDFWEYRIYWHPKEKRAVFEQFGAGGIFGVGEMRNVTLGDGKAEKSVEMVFYSPDGSTWHDLHKLIEMQGEHTTHSFKLEAGNWRPQRTYVWRLVRPT